MSPQSAREIADRITELRDKRPVTPRKHVPPTPQPADDPFWYAVDPRVWEATTRTIDAAADQRLGQFSNDVRALYDERLLRGLGYIYASLTVAKAGEDLLGNPTPRESIEELASALAADWDAFHVGDAQQLAHTLVGAILGKRAVAAMPGGHPRLEHMLVAAGLVLRRLERPSDAYRDRVAEILKQYPPTVPHEWLEGA